jgi:hypothetical protein
MPRLPHILRLVTPAWRVVYYCVVGVSLLSRRLGLVRTTLVLFSRRVCFLRII